MDLDVGPSHSDLLDQQTREPLTLLEVERVHLMPHTLRERVDPASQPVVDGERLPFGHQGRSLLLQLSMPLNHQMLDIADASDLH